MLQILLLQKNFVLKIQMDDIHVERNIINDEQIQFIIYKLIGENNPLESNNVDKHYKINTIQIKYFI